MRKEKLVLLPIIIIGLLMIFYSWYISYPLNIDSPSDFLFNHISPFYWLGLSIVFAGLYIMAILSEKNSLKWIVAISIVILMYSSAYFYWAIPGSDSHYFRGLIEYFVETGDLDPSADYHSYYQWPLFFVLGKIAHIIGLDLRHFEFILFGLLGFLYATSLYSIFHKFSKKGAYLAVISYFILMRYYFNYQFAPFSLGIGLLFLLIMLDIRENKTPAILLAMVVLFTSITLIHSFLPVFFILYIFTKLVINRDSKQVNLLLITSIIYILVLVYQAVIFLPMALERLFALTSHTFATFSQTLLIEAVSPIDEVAQTIGRAIFIATGLVAGSGLVILFLKRKVRGPYFALLISGTIYAIASFLLPLLGVRAFPIIAIPLSLGVIYFQKTKLKLLIQCLFLIIIMLFTFVPLHSSFSSTRTQILFQTEENYQSANFWIRYYDPIERSMTLADFRTAWYLHTKSQNRYASIENDFSLNFPRDANNYDTILFTLAVEKSFLRYNYTTESILQEMNELNKIYDSGSSFIFTNELKKE